MLVLWLVVVVLVLVLKYIDGLPISKGRLVKGLYKPICRECAIYYFNYCIVAVRCGRSRFWCGKSGF